MLQVNLTSVFQLNRDIGAHMLTRTPKFGEPRGNIINIGSLLSFQGGITVPAYAAAKGGIAQLTKALSNEWAGKGILVNASKCQPRFRVSPGLVLLEAIYNDSHR